MMKRALGSTGLQVSALGLGCNNFGGRLDSERTRLVVDAAIAAGITFIDTADAYGNRGGSERLLGETLGNRRKDVVLATKFGLPMDEAGRLGASRAYIMTAVEESLKRLKTEWIDIKLLFSTWESPARGHGPASGRVPQALPSPAWMNPEGEAIVCLCHNPVRHSRGNAAGAPDSTIRATDLGGREPREVMLP
jgi:Aldo/keto reductase family